jgi:hypothetical protein
VVITIVGLHWLQTVQTVLSREFRADFYFALLTFLNPHVLTISLVLVRSLSCLHFDLGGLFIAILHYAFRARTSLYFLFR